MYFSFQLCNILSLKTGLVHSLSTSGYQNPYVSVWTFYLSSQIMHVLETKQQYFYILKLRLQINMCHKVKLQFYISGRVWKCPGAEYLIIKNELQSNADAA